MIVPMKKIAVILQDKDAEDSLRILRKLGILHIEHQEAPKSKDIALLKDDVSILNEALGVLSEGARQDVKEKKETSDWRALAKHLVDCRNRIRQLEQFAVTLKNRIAEWQLWGDFSPSEIQSLVKKGIFLRFYRIPAKEIKNLPPSLSIKKIFSSGDIVGCVVISQENIDIPYKEILPPKMGLGDMQKRLSEDLQIIQSLKKEISDSLCFKEQLIKAKDALFKEIEFNEALSGMAREGELSYIVGYIPYDKAALLEVQASKNKWGLLIEEPSERDAVPTLVRNPRWVSVIRPVFRIIEVIPGYRELDISLWFLVFFSVFFGMLIGDAGYGLVYFLLTLLFHRKLSSKLENKSVFYLFYVLSLCAILWGVLTGTYFGQEWFGSSLKPLIPSLRDDKNIQSLCFFIGATHLTIAHLWRGMVKLPSLTALVDLGWVSILWGAFFLARLLILGEVLPVFAKWLFVIGGGLVLFFTKPEKNILRSLGAGLGNLLLNLVNNFTDIVSYIRLFAVGLATVAVADSFNKMALGIGYNNLIGGLLTSLILLVGHLLNIVLGPMSILVHGVRLNVLEFCNHLDIKWSGFSYRPLNEETLT